MRTAIVNIYNTSGTGSPIYAGKVIQFPDVPGEKLWNHIGGTIGCHTFRLPGYGPGAEVYGVRFSCGIVDGPVRTGGYRFHRIEVDFTADVSVASMTIRTDGGNPYLSVSGDATLVIGGDNGIGYRHQIAPRGSLRARFALNDDMDALISTAKMARPSTRLSPGLEAPFLASQKRTGGNLTAAMARRFLYGRKGVYYPYEDSGDSLGVGSGASIDYSPGHEQSLVLALMRADGAIDRHQVDVLNYADGNPSPISKVTPQYGGGVADPYACYGNAGNSQHNWTKAGQLPEFWASDPGGDPNTAVVPYWHNATAGTDEAFMVTSMWRMGITHLRRVTGAIEALAEVWGDPMAQFDIDMIGQNVQYHLDRWLIPYENQSFQQEKNGHGELGSRTIGSAIDAMYSATMPHLKAAALRWARAIERVQMTNGFIEKKTYTGTANDGSPSPWVGGSTPVDTAWAVHQTMEMTINSWSCLRCGVDSVVRSQVFNTYVGGSNSGGSARDFPLIETVGGGYVPKYVVTAKAGVNEHRITAFNHGGDFWSWTLLALGIYTTPWKSVLLSKAVTLSLPEGGIGTTLGNTINILNDPTKSGEEQTAIAVQALSAPILV